MGFSADMQKGLAQIGGLGVGALIGAASKIPLDSHYQRKLLDQALEETRMKEHSGDRWRTLFKLYDGTIRLEDLPPVDRKIYENLLEEHKDELNHLAHRPDLKQEALEDLNKGHVVPFRGDNKIPMTKPYAYKVRHPAGKGLTGLAAIAGGYGAGALYDNIHKK